MGDLTWWLGIVGLVALVALGGLFIFWARRWARGPTPAQRPGFTLEDLRDMLERGEITQREYDTARTSLVNKARQMARSERARRGGTDWSGPESGPNQPRKR